MSQTTEWSEQDVKVLRELQKSCLVHLYLQSKSAYMFHVLNNLIVIPNILIGAVLSVSLFSMQNERWKIMSGVLAIICTFLSSIGKHISAGEKSQLHCHIARQYERLYRDIKLNMNLITDGSQQHFFVTSVKTEIDKVFSTQPDPPLSVIRYFEKTHKKNVESILHPEMEEFAKEIFTQSMRITNRISKYVKKDSINEASSIELPSVRAHRN